MVASGVLVGVLVLTVLHARLVHLDARVERVVDDLAGLDVLELGADESRAFAGLDVEELNDEVQLVVVLDAHAVAEICSSCHILCLL